ncbi:hypothetical protein C8F04DRAFT_1177574 [Mycena alexandri]|uniref:F-box domain-containing protein n=1 Tax=Mycena alexandri TaxID=1745969 RepID=A0AAD6XA64_9AGAR|nr:hypothetical protein C8F04DRAFT_1177574 [Mycena alexandri]
MASTSISRFPVEIGLNIFVLLFYGAPQFNFSAFVRTRRVACNASSEWRRFICAYPAFWQQIYVDLFTPVELITLYAIRAGAGSIDLCITIEFLKDYQLLNVKQDARRIAGRINLLRPLISRAKTLLLQVDDRSAYNVILELLPTIHTPLLQEVVIRYQFERERWDYGVSQHTSGWHGINTDNLTYVHLNNTLFPFPFLHGQPLAIRDLHIYNLGSGGALEAGVLRAIIHAAPHLTSLVLVKVDCTNENQDIIISASIIHLHLEFKDGTEASRLAAKFRFGALNSLTLRVASSHDVDGALRCESILSDVRHLTIHDEGRDVYTFGNLADKLTGVTHLDMSHSGATLDILTSHSSLNKARGRTTVFPSLQSVIVGGVTPEQLVRFCKLHGVGDDNGGQPVTLRVLTFVTERTPLNHHNHITWLSANMPSFVVESTKSHRKATEEANLRRVVR